MNQRVPFEVWNRVFDHFKKSLSKTTHYLWWKQTCQMFNCVANDGEHILLKTMKRRLLNQNFQEDCVRTCRRCDVKNQPGIRLTLYPTMIDGYWVFHNFYVFKYCLNCIIFNFDDTLQDYAFHTRTLIYS